MVYSCITLGTIIITIIISKKLGTRSTESTDYILLLGNYHLSRVVTVTVVIPGNQSRQKGTCQKDHGDHISEMWQLSFLLKGLR